MLSFDNADCRNEPPHDKTNKMTCAPSKSDQPGHPPSLIGVIAVRMRKHWVLSYQLSAQRRVWSDWADAQADLSLRGAHVILLVLSCCGSNVFDRSGRVLETNDNCVVYLPVVNHINVQWISKLRPEIKIRKFKQENGLLNPQQLAFYQIWTFTLT